MHVSACVWECVCVWDFQSVMFFFFFLHPCVWCCLQRYECSCGFLRTSKHSLMRHCSNVFGHGHGQSEEISPAIIVFWCYTGSGFLFARSWYSDTVVYHHKIHYHYHCSVLKVKTDCTSSLWMLKWKTSFTWKPDDSNTMWSNFPFFTFTFHIKKKNTWSKYYMNIQSHSFSKVSH